MCLQLNKIIFYKIRSSNISITLVLYLFMYVYTPKISETNKKFTDFMKFNIKFKCI